MSSCADNKVPPIMKSDSTNPPPEEDPEYVFYQELPSAIRMQEKRELTKLRNILRRRRGRPTTRLQKAWAATVPYLHLIVTAFCLQLPLVFRDRHRRLFYAVMELETWPHMFDKLDARGRATQAWETYINTLLTEWNSMNVVTALIISSAVAFLALPGIPPVSTYSMIIAICSSLASLSHATYYSQFYRTLVDDKPYSLIQLRHFCAVYEPLTAYLLCLPTLNFIYALGGFSIGTIAYIWPGPDSNAPTAAPYLGRWLAKSTIPLIFLCQLGLIPISYKWNRSAFFTTDELLPAEEFRRQQVDDWEDRMANEQLEFIAEQRMEANSIPILNLPVESKYIPAFVSSTFKAKECTDPDDITEKKDDIRWVSSKMANIPDGAIPLGYEGEDYPSMLYAARVHHKGGVHFGKAGIHLMGGAAISFDGRELRCSTYDVLAGDSKSVAWLRIPRGVCFTSVDLNPPGWMFVSGGETDGIPVFVAAIEYDGGLHIGKVHEGEDFARVPYGYNEIRESSFRVLMTRS